MTTLLVAEHDNDALRGATLNALSAARLLGEAVHVLIAGSGAAAAARAAAELPGVEKVLLADAPHLADGLADEVEATVLTVASDYSHIVFGATAYGKSVAPRVAASLDVAQVSEISAVIDANTFERPIYAGNAVATVRSTDPIKVLTVRATGFDASPQTGGTCPIEPVPAADPVGRTTFVSRELSRLERPELTSAKIVVSGGRGLGSGENYTALLAPLADTLGAAMGASRAAVDAGFAPNDYQVGQTGKIVAPKLYVAVGISGAIQHLAGMKDSQVIVAINKDAEAPIFGVADYGLVGDLFVAVPELVAALSD